MLKVVPSFCLTNSVMYASSKEKLYLARKKLTPPTDDFDMQNMGGDILASTAHFFIWTLVLILIESGVFNWVWSLIDYFRKTVPPKLKLD